MLTARFIPHPLVRGGQLQTLVGFLFHGSQALTYDQELKVTLPGGDDLLLEVNEPAQPSTNTPIVYLLHGLGGNSESTYKLRIAAKLKEKGFRVVRHNHRGCSPRTQWARGIYHSGSIDDIRIGLEALAKTWPESSIYVVGFSLSGTILLNLLGSQPGLGQEIPQVQGALSVCAPLDLHASSAALSHWGNRHIDLHYFRTLIARFLELGLMDETFARTQFKERSLRQFDEMVTAPRGGFQSLDDYYTRCSPKRVLHAIQVPTTILSAADDPIVPPESVLGASFSPSTDLSLQNSGGHLGFLARDVTEFGDRRWLDSFVVDWACMHWQSVKAR